MRFFHRNTADIRTIALILLLGAGAWVVMYVLVGMISADDTNLNYGIFSVIMIAIGLIVPYLMLKLVAHEAHRRDSRESEMNLKDIPKDQEQLHNS